MIWVGPAKNFAPAWLFESEVPVVYVVDDVNAAITIKFIKENKSFK